MSCKSNPAVVGFALPFMIDADEKKLQKTPDNDELRLETGKYSIMYANAFVEGPAMMLSAAHFDKRERELAKAKEYYLRGAALLREGLGKKFPGINETKAAGLKSYLDRMTKDDVPALYWTVAGSIAAYALDPFDLELGLQIPELTLFIKRAYELDPDFEQGTLDSFFISFYGSLPPALGGDVAKAKTFFKSAVEKSGGKAASPYVSYVTAIVIPEQDRAAFREYLGKALAVNIADNKQTAEEKLANTIAQNKAKFYLKNEERFIPSLDGVSD